MKRILIALAAATVLSSPAPDPGDRRRTAGLIRWFCVR